MVDKEHSKPTLWEERKSSPTSSWLVGLLVSIWVSRHQISFFKSTCFPHTYAATVQTPQVTNTRKRMIGSNCMEQSLAAPEIRTEKTVSIHSSPKAYAKREIPIVRPPVAMRKPTNMVHAILRVKKDTSSTTALMAQPTIHFSSKNTINPKTPPDKTTS